MDIDTAGEQAAIERTRIYLTNCQTIRTQPGNAVVNSIHSTALNARAQVDRVLNGMVQLR